MTFHGPIPEVILNDNIIVGNDIAGNQADSGDAATPGPMGINVFGSGPITGIVISHNVIKDETLDIAVNTPAQVDVHLKELLGENSVGVDDLGSDPGTVNATENWWGCSEGPGAEACSSVDGPGVLFAPWLTRPFSHEGEHDATKINDENLPPTAGVTEDDFQRVILNDPK